MRLVAISDVHTKWQNIVIPECDVLISAGDYSFHGQPDIVKSYHEWLNEQPAKRIISGQGNHEEWVEKNFEAAKEIAIQACPRVDFLEEGGVTIEGVNFWYSSITPYFNDWAYNKKPGSDIDKHWQLIPENTNVLITHGPPYGILDVVFYPDGVPKERVGCWNLKEKVKQIKPDIHIFGHLHDCHGEVHENGTSYYNVAICDDMYMPSNPVTSILYVSS